MSTRFPIRFTGVNRVILRLLGLGERSSYVEVDADRLTVRMGWAFHGTVARSSIGSVADDHDRVLGWGAHGWRGVWLVNGSSSGIVRIEIDPPGTARVVGVPVGLRVLRVSVDDPVGLQRTLALPDATR